MSDTARRTLRMGAVVLALFASSYALGLAGAPPWSIAPAVLGAWLLVSRWVLR